MSEGNPPVTAQNSVQGHPPAPAPQGAHAERTGRWKQLAEDIQDTAAFYGFLVFRIAIDSALIVIWGVAVAVTNGLLGRLHLEQGFEKDVINLGLKVGAGALLVMILVYVVGDVAILVKRLWKRWHEE